MKKEECGYANSFGVASVVLGLIGSVLGVFVLPIVLSILGLIFGIIQYKKEKNAWAIWGIVLSLVGILISVLLLWQIVTAASQMQQLLATCQANPAAAGCADLLKLTGAQ